MWDYQTTTTSTFFHGNDYQGTQAYGVNNGPTFISYGYVTSCGINGGHLAPNPTRDETFVVNQMMVARPPPVALDLAAVPFESPGLVPSAERRSRWHAWQQSQTRARRSRRRRARPVGFQARR